MAFNLNISPNNRQFIHCGHYSFDKMSVNVRNHIPSSVTVWVGITASGKVSLVLVGKNIRINTKYCQNY
uniref:Transposase n=1 Tax=Heterorhabditis bacteriophora TaxID=37862 RepID=A0A1I7WFI7_HETBA